MSLVIEIILTFLCIAIWWRAQRKSKLFRKCFIWYQLHSTLFLLLCLENPAVVWNQKGVKGLWNTFWPFCPGLFQKADLLFVPPRAILMRRRTHVWLRLEGRSQGSAKAKEPPLSSLSTLFLWFFFFWNNWVSPSISRPHLILSRTTAASALSTLRYPSPALFEVRKVIFGGCFLAPEKNALPLIVLRGDSVAFVFTEGWRR